MQARRRAQPSSTNKPRGLTILSVPRETARIRSATAPSRPRAGRGAQCRYTTGPAATAGRKYPFPCRTRKSSSPAPMILPPGRESRSPPAPFFICHHTPTTRGQAAAPPPEIGRRMPMGGFLGYPVFFLLLSHSRTPLFPESFFVFIYKNASLKRKIFTHRINASHSMKALSGRYIFAEE